MFEKKEEEIFMINWNNPRCKISKHFTVHEATFLPSWRVYHMPSDEEKVEIVELAKKIDKLRDKLNQPFIVHVWMRPKKVNCQNSPKHGKDYNVFIGSKSTKSGHIFGQAVDFHVSGSAGPNSCNLVREKIKPELESLNLRMEDIQGGWIHIDSKKVGHKRFFKP